MLPKIPRHELAIVFRLFAYCFLVGASYTLAKTAADSLFLSRIGSASLPIEFLAAGVATALFATLWLWAAKKIYIGRLLRLTSYAMAVGYLALWWTLPMMDHSFELLSLVYVLAEIKGCLYAIVAVSAMNETLGRKSSRQSWATVLIGFPLAAVVVGTAVGYESKFWDADNWLLVAGLLDLASVCPGIRILSVQNKRRKKAKKLRKLELAKRQVKSAKIVRRKKRSRSDSAARLLENVLGGGLNPKQYADSESFAKWLSILIGAKVIVLTLVAFNWKVSVNEYLGGSERSLATFFGWYYALVGASTLLLQFFVTGRCLAHQRAVVPIAVLPTMILLLVTFLIVGASVGMGIASVFYITTMAKSMDAWRRSTHDTAIHLLYTSVKKRKRRGLIGHNHGLVKPGSEIAAGVVLVCSPVGFQYLVLGIAAGIWLLATFAVIGIEKVRLK